MKKVFGLILVILCCAEFVDAQSFYNFRNTRKFIVSVGSGVTSYFGDLNDPGDVIDTRPNLNVGLQYFFTNRVSARAELTWLQLSGDDESSEAVGRQLRNLSFVSDNFELTAVGIINAFPNGAKFYQRPYFNAYAFAGLGVLYFNPKGELNGEKIALQPLQTEGVDYSRTTIVVPLGGGIKVKAGPFFNVVLEGGYRITFTDYLDDVSTTYIANSSFTDDVARVLADRRPEIGLPVLEPGSKRGNPDKNDGYLIFSVKVEYFLPNAPIKKTNYKRRRRNRGVRRR
ncbi:MAG: DUF6089 family protein [Bacteroidota bacterium]